MIRLRLATAWLDGCSGCHMSFLDLDERLLDLAPRIDLVYGPLVDAKDFPPHVDVVLVEGAVSTEDDLRRLRRMRERSRVLVALGDCAVTANVPGLRNRFTLADIEARAYRKLATLHPGVPRDGVPRLFERSRPLHEFVAVDLFVPGCPPAADTIHFLLDELLAGRRPDLAGHTRFGA